MSKNIDEKSLASDRAYEARGIIARINKIGNIETGPLIALPVYQFLTLDAGPGREKILVEFVGPAPYDENQELDLNAVQEGDIIVNPGLLYRRRSWTQALMTEHLAQLRFYRPSVIVKSDVDRSTPAEEIVIDPLGLSTKQ